MYELFRFEDINFQTESQQEIFSNIKTIKHDSLIARLRPDLLTKYFVVVCKSGGEVIFAKNNEGLIIGLLVFNRDNRITLNFLKEYKLALVSTLGFSFSMTDKILLYKSIINSILIKDLDNEYTKNEISLVAVLDKYQGKGVGTSMINEILQIPDEIIHIKTDEGNLGARALYRKIGFREVVIEKIGTRRLACMRYEKNEI